MLSTMPASVFHPYPNNLRLNYGNGAADIRNRFTFSPTYLIPGMKSPGQMLEGWSVSALVIAARRAALDPAIPPPTDLLGTGEINNTAADSDLELHRASLRLHRRSTPPFPVLRCPLSGCTSFANTPAVIQAECASAAVAPYAPGSHKRLNSPSLHSRIRLLRARTVRHSDSSRLRNLGDASRNIFRGPNYYNVDLSVAKIWKFKERYSAQFRAEFFNLFNRADFVAVPGHHESGKGSAGSSVVPAPRRTAPP